MTLEVALKAIAEPRRRDILLLIQEEELSSSEIAAHFSDISHPAISQHLGVLAKAGLVNIRKQGTRRLYRGRPEGLAEVKQYLEGYWTTRLNRLAQAAEAEEQARGN